MESQRARWFACVPRGPRCGHRAEAIQRWQGSSGQLPKRRVGQGPLVLCGDVDGHFGRPQRPGIGAEGAEQED
eukprot:10493427-Lingulodinium_polyedra.AAC.1